MQEVFEKYNNLAIALTQLWRVANQVFPAFSINDLFQLIRLPLGNKLVHWLQRYYIASFPDKFGSFEPDAAIRAGLVKLPDFAEVINAHSQVYGILRFDLGTGSYSGIRFPLIQLFDAQNNCFVLTEDFKNEVDEFYSCFVTSPAENRIYEALQNVAKALNNLDGFVQLQGNYSDDKINFLNRLLEHQSGKWDVKHHALSALGFSKARTEPDPLERMFQV
jgi:hypothetical protein